LSWTPPANDRRVPFRQRATAGEWRAAIELVARRHGLFPCELEPYEKGETVVWRAGEHVIKLTSPECAYQIEAEVGCLGAVAGKLPVEVPRLFAHGELEGFPYVVMQRLGGRPLAEVWPRLDAEQRRRLAGDLGRLCHALHALPPPGFRPDWESFFRSCRADLPERQRRYGGPLPLLEAIEPFLRRVGPLDDGPLVPLHTEVLDQHVYVVEEGGTVQLSGLIDFADARLGPYEYEFSGVIEFIFRGEPGLLREFLLAYGLPEARLTSAYSETLLAWSLSHRFTQLRRLLAVIAPRAPESLEALAAILFSVEPAR